MRSGGRGGAPPVSRGRTNLWFILFNGLTAHAARAERREEGARSKGVRQVVVGFPVLGNSSCGQPVLPERDFEK